MYITNKKSTNHIIPDKNNVEDARLAEDATKC